MSFEWKHYYLLAKELGGDRRANPCPESKQRSSISRAYYSVFCISRDFLNQKYGFVICTTRNSHQQVIDELLNYGPEEKEISQKLKRLKMFRIKADYESNLDSKYLFGKHLQSIILAGEILDIYINTKKFIK
ncbi:MAG: hypothetical protein GX428_00030 [Candidatus Atribacteria bacterium]|nr:hypothetical protein [Candidatus Atribacteria bacterium]